MLADHFEEHDLALQADQQKVANYYRSGEYGVASMCVVLPVIISVISLPVDGAKLRPSMLWPVARYVFFAPEADQ